MDTHVADNAVAVLHERTPAARVHELVVRAHRSWPGPHLVVQVVRWLSVRGTAGGSHMVVAIDLNEADFAQAAFTDYAITRGGQMGRAATLHADLHDALILAGCRKHCLPLDDVHAERFLDPDVGTR